MKPNNRNQLYAALIALTDTEEGIETPGKGFKTAKAFEADFDLGAKQTYVWLERLVASGMAEKRNFRVRVGIYRRDIPHYRLGQKAASIVRKLKGGRKPRGEA